MGTKRSARPSSNTCREGCCQLPSNPRGQIDLTPLSRGRALGEQDLRSTARPHQAVCVVPDGQRLAGIPAYGDHGARRERRVTALQGPRTIVNVDVLKPTPRRLKFWQQDPQRVLEFIPAKHQPHFVTVPRPHELSRLDILRPNGGSKRKVLVDS